MEKIIWFVNHMKKNGVVQGVRWKTIVMLVNSKGYICTDINSEEAIFVEVGKEKESKLEWLQDKLNVAEFEVKILQQKIEELKKEN